MEISWPGDYGEIHTRILERMKQVLEENTEYPYLKKNAKTRLEVARRVARNTGMLKNSLVHLGRLYLVSFSVARHTLLPHSQKVYRQKRHAF